MNGRLHPPKIEVFDLGAMTNTDPKGFVRAVDEYRLTAHGLFMARPVAGHPDIAYFQSWLLPGLGLRVNKWDWHPGAADTQDFYIDVVDIETGPAWRTTDLYLDILVRTGQEVWVLDTDETLAALRAGLIDQDAAERAFDHAFRAVGGIAGAHRDVDAWLTGQGLAITWSH